MREKNKLQYQKEYQKGKQDQDLLEHDIEFLDKIEEKFDPLESFFISQQKQKKRQRYE